MPRKGSACAFLLAALAACSGTPTATLVLTTGGEADALSRTPAPTRLTLEAVAADGAAELLADLPLPAASMVPLPDVAFDRVARFRVTAFDAGGTALLRGLTLDVQAGALGGVDFPVFVQRTRELARMPAPLADGREAPLLALSGGRHVVVAGGPPGGRDGALYDLAFLKSYAFPAPLPRAPRSMVAIGSDLLVIDEAGANWVNLSTFETGDAAAPAGGSFADVAGGATVPAESGVAYVVGATRQEGAETARVLRVAPDGTLAFVTLARPRRGATATWVVGRGLVVADGAPDGPGLELLPPNAATPVSLPYVAREVTGAAAVQLEGTTLALVGGKTAQGAAAPGFTVDLACAAACAPAAFGGALQRVLAPAVAFHTGEGAVLLVGDAPDGASHAVRVGRTDAVDVPFRIPRRGGRAIRLPTGHVAVAGGASAIESYLE